MTSEIVKILFQCDSHFKKDKMILKHQVIIIIYIQHKNDVLDRKDRTHINGEGLNIRKNPTTYCLPNMGSTAAPSTLGWRPTTSHLARRSRFQSCTASKRRRRRPLPGGGGASRQKNISEWCIHFLILYITPTSAHTAKRKPICQCLCIEAWCVSLIWTWPPHRQPSFGATQFEAHSPYPPTLPPAKRE
jgi:hypothetical protein